MWRHFKTSPSDIDVEFIGDDDVDRVADELIDGLQVKYSISVTKKSRLFTHPSPLKSVSYDVWSRRQSKEMDCAALYDLAADEEEERTEESASRRPSFRISSPGSAYRVPSPPTTRPSRSGSNSPSSKGNTRSESRLSPNPSTRSRSQSPIPNRLIPTSKPAPPAPPPPTVTSTPSTVTKPTNPTMNNSDMAAMFDPSKRGDRKEPEMPTADGVEYPRAASWASGKLANVLADDKGRQLFRVFLFQSLADENLNFLEAVEKLRKMKSNEEKKSFAKEIISKYAVSINLSAPAMQKIQKSANSDDPDVNDWAPALKEVRRLLENDQFPRFRRSECYLAYLELLLPRSYAEKWASSFEALLGNNVGRHHFRLFLRSIRAEENLRFWDAVVEFRSAVGKQASMVNQAKEIISTFLVEGTPNEVFLPYGLKQTIDKKMEDEDVDIMLFDEAIKHVEQVLRNDPYVRFLQSKEYLGLLDKLRNDK